MTEPGRLAVGPRIGAAEADLLAEAVQGGQGMITFAAKLPGRILPIEIAQGQGYLVHRHGWMCGTPGITPTIGLQQTFKGGLWGGDGFILQRLEGGALRRDRDL